MTETTSPSADNRIDNYLIGGAALLILVALILLGFLLFNNNSNRQQVRVLFLGNSYTGNNDLPDLFARLARSGGHRANIDSHVRGGWQLDDHINSADSRRLITNQTWDYVVLQEQSVVPSLSTYRQEEMYPAARQLNTLITDNNSTPLFYLTWGRQNGLPDAGHTDYATMQSALINGYMAIANELNAVVAPVGVAWREVRRRHPEINLYQGDGSHPNLRGSYLAACVFYAAVFGESPEGLRYDADLPPEQVQVLQRIAAETVLSDQARWHLRPITTEES